MLPKGYARYKEASRARRRIAALNSENTTFSQYLPQIGGIKHDVDIPYPTKIIQ